MTWYPAPGKLNLFLHLLGLRTAGYHELQTVFRLIDRCDRVGIAPRSDGNVRFEGPFGEENLCVRAARLLQRETGSRRGAELRLEKHLPLGGGLGGGPVGSAPGPFGLQPPLGGQPRPAGRCGDRPALRGPPPRLLSLRSPPPAAAV